MRIFIVYFFIFSLAFGGLFFLIHQADSPESLVIGQWSEVAWEYEKTDKPLKDSLSKGYITEYVKFMTGQDLIIHEAESWEFMPDGTLRLRGENLDKTVRWRIKGRGHLLLLKYNDNEEEHYNITELSKDKLVLNFESDAQARGIAKLTFSKN